MATANQTTWCFGSNGSTISRTEQIPLFLGISDLELDHSCFFILLWIWRVRLQNGLQTCLLPLGEDLEKEGKFKKTAKMSVSCFVVLWLAGRDLDTVCVSETGLVPATTSLLSVAYLNLHLVFFFSSKTISVGFPSLRSTSVWQQEATTNWIQ